MSDKKKKEIQISYEQDKVPNQEHLITIWEKAIDVQMHFNELIIKFRTQVLTIMITMTGGILVLARMTENGVFHGPVFSGLPVYYLFIVPISIWVAVFLIDRVYYHNMLIGAVKYGQAISKHLKTTKGEPDLNDVIGKEAPLLKVNIGMYSFYALPLFSVIILGYYMYRHNIEINKVKSNTEVSETKNCVQSPKEANNNAKTE